MEAFFVQFVCIFQMAGQQDAQEAQHAQQEGDSVPAPVTVRIGMRGMRMRLFLFAAFGLEGIVEPGRKRPGMHHEFHQQARPDTQDQEDGEQEGRLLREQGQHQEGFISRRRNQHGQQRAESQHLMGIERYRCKPAQAAGNTAQQGRYQDLSRAGSAQAVQPFSMGFNVERLDEHHHDDHQAAHQYGRPQSLNQNLYHYSIQPLINRFTMGRRGELVVSVRMTSTSPEGIPEVSNVALSFPDAPGFTAPGTAMDTRRLSASAL